MKEKTFFSEYEINSETLRYSSDIPGQALGYKLGDTKILELRDRGFLRPLRRLKKMRPLSQRPKRHRPARLRLR